MRSALVADGCRYWLKRAWGSGGHICWIMCNPSLADDGKDDPTMLRVMDFSARWGYGSCVVINPIPFISSTPAEALAWWKRVGQAWLIEMESGRGISEARHTESKQWNANMGHAVRCIGEAQAHVVAWGNNLPRELWNVWLQEVAEQTDDGCGGGMPDGAPPPVEWICLGTTQSGAPKHPLARGLHRVPPEFKPIRWEK